MMVAAIGFLLVLLILAWMLEMGMLDLQVRRYLRGGSSSLFEEVGLSSLACWRLSFPQVEEDRSYC
jgi:hypothetical protein